MPDDLDEHDRELSPSHRFGHLVAERHGHDDETVQGSGRGQALQHTGGLRRGLDIEDRHLGAPTGRGREDAVEPLPEGRKGGEGRKDADPTGTPAGAGCRGGFGDEVGRLDGIQDATSRRLGDLRRLVQSLRDRADADAGTCRDVIDGRIALSLAHVTVRDVLSTLTSL